MSKHSPLSLCVLSVCMMAKNAAADSVTGTIHTLDVDAAGGRAYVQLEGLPWFNGGGCPSYWTVNDLTDQNFVKFIWPLLMMAKATGSRVTIVTNGCIGSWSKIVAAETDPRLAD